MSLLKYLALNKSTNKTMRQCFKLTTFGQTFNKNMFIRKYKTSRLSVPNIFRVNKILNSTNLFRSYSQFNESIIKISDEIESALMENRPVVALESTIITHGMPFPVNLKTAQNVEQIVRKEGAIPATIAVLEGAIYVGLNNNQLAFLAEESQTGRLTKISRSDLPVVVSNKFSGGTTVSATSLIANRCGIDIFVTGGIGGVHRGVEHSLDISADLTELGRTPITVVCAGVKSILDIPKTLEFLETHGVCVMVFNGDQRPNSTKVEFPAFFSRKSGSQILYNIENKESAAKVILDHKKLGLESGIVIAVPISEESQSIVESVNRAIDEALNEVNLKGIVGKDVTPYVLQRVNQLSDGTSLKANIALIENNARIGAQIAVQYYELIAGSTNLSINTLKPSKGLHNKFKDSMITNGSNKSSKLSKSTIESMPESMRKEEPIERNGNQSEQLSPVVIGGSIYDIIANADSQSLNLNGSTYKGSIKVSLGGVGRNIFDCLSRLGLSPIFISAIGNDSNGVSVLNNNPLKNPKGLLISEVIPTSSCSVVVDGKGECGLLVGDMRCHDLITAQHISHFANEIRSAPIVVIDANIPTDSMSYVLDICSDYQIPVWYEPTDISQCSRIFIEPTGAHRSLMFMSPNYYELETIANFLSNRKQDITYNINDIPLNSVIENCYQMSKQIMETYFHSIVITLGKYGVLVISKSKKEDIIRLGPQSQLFLTNQNFEQNETKNSLNVFHLPQENLDNKIVNVSGGGDCFASAMIYSLIDNKSLYESASIGLKAAKLSLLSTETIPQNIGLIIK